MIIEPDRPATRNPPERFAGEVWLEPIALARNLGYPARELTRILAVVREHRAELLEAWHGHFGDRR